MTHYFPFLSIGALRYCLVFRLVVQHYGGMMRRDSIERERFNLKCAVYSSEAMKEKKKGNPANNKSTLAR